MQMMRLPFLLAMALSLLCVAAMAEEKAAAPEPVTTADPSIPVDELGLLLKPLTKAQLLIEAEAWQGLVQSKAEEISRAEIAVKRQNQEIDKAQAIEEAAAKAKQQLEEVGKQATEARASGDEDAIAKADAAAADAREQMDIVKQRVEEAAGAAERSAAIRDELSEEVKAKLEATEDAAQAAGAAVDDLTEVVDEAKGKTGEVLLTAAQEVRDATGQAEEATDVVAERAADVANAERDSAQTMEAADALDAGAAAAVGEQAAESKKDEKVALLEAVADLREQRTLLLDQFKSVLTALEAKTDEGDADTLAKIADYKLYASAVKGIELDVKDTTSAWLAIKGWAMSDEGGTRWAVNLASFIGILLVAWIIAGIASGLIHRAVRRVPGASKLLEDFVVKAVRWVVLAIGLIMALASLEVSIGPLLAMLGAAGFVVAFALQDSLSNFASGLMILFFKPFDVGDVVDAGGVSGSVESVNLVSTTIKTFDNKKMVVPNNRVWGDVITNASGVTERRVDMEFGIGYDDDIDQAQAILEEIVNAHPQVLQEPSPTIRMSALADSSVNFIVRPWTKTADYWTVFWDITREVKMRFDAADIGIPFPQRDVHLYIANGGDKLPGLMAAPAPAPAPETGAKSDDGGLDR
ncbi:mechanosensitive ion channel family protein [Thiocapsa marina]|uniref:Small-conductance mechanosensitive channel n=1 Tax=Thiocapsa marina 5811 TaxID=768671 RepID=F9UDS7_9GAMM|nr:mechanosensitive ion channel family protein [Thiocapsa marina]EGV17484.1 MscS Mechanosensitive ion channel [Thiocapsa marina 5811]